MSPANHDEDAMEVDTIQSTPPKQWQHHPSDSGSSSNKKRASSLPASSLANHAYGQTAAISWPRRQLVQISKDKLKLKDELDATLKKLDSTEKKLEVAGKNHDAAEQKIRELESRWAEFESGVSAPRMTRSKSKKNASAQHTSDQGNASTLAELKRRVRDLEAELSARPSQADFDKLEAKYTALKGKVIQQRDAKAAADIVNNSLQEALSECKLKIASLQPAQYIPDGHMGSKYDSFCKRVASWVDEQIGNAGGYLKTFKDIPWSPEDLGIIEYVFGSVTISDATEAFPNVEPELTQMLVHGILHVRIFSRNEHFPNLPGSVQKFLQDWERGEAALKHRTEERHMSAWAAQCYRALLELDEYRELRQERMKQVAAQLDRIFSALLEGKPGQSYKKGSCYTLVAAASELADEMKSVPANYVPIFDNEAIGQPRLTIGDRESYEIFDAKTGYRLRPTHGTPATKKGIIGTKLTCFAPALVRKGSDGDADLVLRKADLLAVFDKKVDRSNPRK